MKNTNLIQMYEIQKTCYILYIFDHVPAVENQAFSSLAGNVQHKVSS